MDSRHASKIPVEFGSPRLLPLKTKKIRELKSYVGYNLQRRLKQKKPNTMARDLSLKIEFEKEFHGVDHLNDIIKMMEQQNRILKFKPDV